MKTHIVLFFLLINFQVFSQHINFGATGGVVISSLAVEGYDEEGTSNSSVGFSAGLLAEVYLTDYLIFQPGLNFIQKGGSWDFPTGTDEFTLHYLELPLHVLYKKGKLMAGAGPALGFGLSGKLEARFSNGTTAEYDAKFSKEGASEPKRLEFGASVMVGYEIINGVFVAAYFNQSLNENIFSIDGNNFNEIKNRYFGIRVGYMLKR